MSPSDTHPHVFVTFSVDERLKNLTSLSNKDHLISRTEVQSGGVTESKNNGLPS